MPFIADYSKVNSLISHKSPPSIFLLGGEETFLCTKLEKNIITTLLDESEKDFNLSILYGADTFLEEIMSHVLRYPMLANRRVVVVKDAQKLRKTDGFEEIIERTPQTTTLVINLYGKNIDRRLKWVKSCEAKGVVFNSPILTKYRVKGPLEMLLKESGIHLDNQAKELLIENTGTDLTRLSQELDKLLLTPEGKSGKPIPYDTVAEYIGISRDFNYFELQKALIYKDAATAIKIIQIYADDPKGHPLQVTLSMLFNFFSNLFIAYYSPHKQEDALAKYLGLSGSFQARDYLIAMKNFSPYKVMQIISLIRRSDARGKGLYTYEGSTLNILTDIVYFITR